MRKGDDRQAQDLGGRSIGFSCTDHDLWSLCLRPSRRAEHGRQMWEHFFDEAQRRFSVMLCKEGLQAPEAILNITVSRCVRNSVVGPGTSVGAVEEKGKG